jgi:uncharacterized membrane protein YeaQ/YmgE (transglycosylase-associated protein family)
MGQRPRCHGGIVIGIIGAIVSGYLSQTWRGRRRRLNICSIAAAVVGAVVLLRHRPRI